MVIKERSSTVTKKGLQGILYDHDRDQLLICDMGSSRIIELDPTTGILIYLSYLQLLIYLLKEVPRFFVIYPIHFRLRNVNERNIW